MSADFFERQDRARRQTLRLLVMFALAVAVIIVAVYLIAVLATSGGNTYYHGRPVSREVGDFWNPGLLAAVALGTILVVSLGSLYKIAELASGGAVVAQMMGGRLVDPQTINLKERRLLNVVEEMALASGVPVPPVFVLDNEPSINAFAAGYQPGDAVVAVSRGCLDYLTREELQGVLGHEFSHVLNGDMRLNLRLVGLVFGILVLSIIGYYVMRIAGSGSYSSRDSDRRGDNRAAFFFIGLALYILGYLGVFLGQIIRSAISRQREFLADASSVQFTRNPAGLAGALKKIGGLADGSRIRDAHAHEISHMFFGDAFAGSFLNLFATHPPLEERIRLLDPTFDGHFQETEPVPETDETAVSPLSPSPARPLPPSLPTDVRETANGAIGRPQPEHLEHAGRLLAGMPQTLGEAVREPYSARAGVFALLLSRDDEPTRSRQLQMLGAQVEQPVLNLTRQLAAAVDGLSPDRRLPLVDLAVPALKRISPQQYTAFRQIVEALTAVDGHVDLFEYCLRVVLFGYLDVHFGLKQPAAARYRSIAAVAQPAAVVLSSIAFAGQSRAEDVQHAFQAGTASLGSMTLLSPPDCTFDSFDAALGQLAQGIPQVKRAVLSAVVACIAADGKMTLAENELLRAVAAALGCPMPPVAVAVQ